MPFPLMPVFFLVGIFYLNFTSRVVLSPLLPVLERDLGLGHGQAGSLFLLAQLGYCGGLLGSGFVSWRWNHRWTITLSTLGVGLALLAVSQATSVTGIRAWLVLLGVFAGLYLPSGITKNIFAPHSAAGGLADHNHRIALWSGCRPIGPRSLGRGVLVLIRVLHPGPFDPGDRAAVHLSRVSR